MIRPGRPLSILLLAHDHLQPPIGLRDWDKIISVTFDIILKGCIMDLHAQSKLTDYGRNGCIKLGVGKTVSVRSTRKIYRMTNML